MVHIPEIYDNRNIFLSLAGSGNPWEHFKPSSKLTIRALFDGYTLEEIQEMFQVTEEELLEKINLLIDASLLRKEKENYYPDFLIVNEEEAIQTFNHSKKIGRILADEIKSSWSEIKNKYDNLLISQRYSFDDLALMLVGSKILDIGFLQALVKDGSLLIPAPNRPSPKRPDARYYFFMVEGNYEHLGKFGENSKDLPWKNWTFDDFGLNIINGKPNEHRSKIEEKCTKYLEKQEFNCPEDLANELNVPFLSHEDSLIWREFSDKIANNLMLKTLDKKEEILQFYKNLKISDYTNNSLGEFICWYMHIAYSWAIDFLVNEKILYMPDKKFNCIIMFFDGPRGLVSE